MAERNSGYTIIPATQRPDGTWRKEIKVKAGYVPPDEMDRYQSKGRQIAVSSSGVPPGMAAEENSATKKTKNQKKNERRKAKRQEMKTHDATSQAEGDALTSNLGNMDVKDEKTDEPQASKEAIAKKLKNLKKKLRQIEELEKKVSNNEIKELSKEQKDKISRKKDVLDEIEDLELDLKLCDD